jgi:hypothetical protein
MCRSRSLSLNYRDLIYHISFILDLSIIQKIKKNTKDPHLSIITRLIYQVYDGLWINQDKWDVINQIPTNWVISSLSVHRTIIKAQFARGLYVEEVDRPVLEG